MDNRKKPRPAQKRYRNSEEGLLFTTVSLILTTDLVATINDKLAKNEEYDSNMSKFIEMNIDTSMIKKIEGRRPYSKKGKTEKKTCTFSENFAKDLKKSGNMSLTVENLLSEKFNLSN